MFGQLDILPPDPILGLNQTFQQDDNADKINLSIGVYQNAQGLTPIFTAVKKAEQQLLAAQNTKSYAPQAGDPSFLEHMTRLLLGDELSEQLQDRVAAVMTPGGCGALRMGAELLSHAKQNVTLWVSDPTWANHYPLLQSAGLTLEKYSYYSAETHSVDFTAMLESLQAIPVGDVVLLHGCCHNPTGADISPAQWDQVISVLAERQLTPFIDVAYQGFGDGLAEDAYGVREAVKRLPEVLVAASCSKNFGLYRERIGAVMVITQDPQTTLAAKSHILTAARSSYSMSPYHGGGIVGLLLSDPELTSEWKTELEQVRLRMNRLRLELAEGLNQAQSRIDFSFVAESKGMFCYLGIPLEVVHALRSEFGIYLLDSTRINVAGLSQENLPIIIDRVSEVLSR
ncbi:aromatic amino acid transaminase [Arenicella xantha]|uniref:Aminotransferase n=1 Tax=Arenicella xantha TaxID=644221 RepID=A0A395JMB9_9GAMM|nr:amino acid aminotransferase [Arenicella xantha]RBP50808.1 aspartate aminotransferase [Arenicella xantha]